MNKAETMECVDCSGRGFRGVKGGLCATCNGTGVRTTGEVVGTPLPRWPEVRPIREESGARAMSDKATTTTCSACGGTGFFDARHYDRFCPTCEGTGTAPKGNSPENPESSGEVAGSDKADEEDSDDIFIHPVPPKSVSRAFVSADRVDEFKATIAEQAAEIERLRERVSGLEQLHASWADGSLAELTAERDALRAAVDHLKAERDELKGKLDVQQEFIEDYRKTIDRLRTEVERLKGERDSVKHNFASLVAATEQGVDRIRAEKYLAVIEAGDHERLAIIAMHNAAMRAQGARSIAGLPTYVHEPSQEATCDERS